MLSLSNKQKEINYVSTDITECVWVVSRGIRFRLFTLQKILENVRSKALQFFQIMLRKQTRSHFLFWLPFYSSVHLYGGLLWCQRKRKKKRSTNWIVEVDLSLYEFCSSRKIFILWNLDFLHFLFCSSCCLLANYAPGELKTAPLLRSLWRFLLNKLTSRPNCQDNFQFIHLVHWLNPGSMCLDHSIQI